MQDYYLATLTGNLALAEQVGLLMGTGPDPVTTTTPAPSLEGALREATALPAVQAAIDQREAARAAARAYLVPAS